MNRGLVSVILLLTVASCDSLTNSQIEPEDKRPKKSIAINHDIWMTSANPIRKVNKTGFEVNFYKDAVTEEGMRIDGKMNGIWINYYSDGTVKSQIGYWDDMLDGVYRTYYPDGLLKEEGYHFRQEKPVFETRGMIEPETNDSIWVVSILNNKLLKHGFWNKYDSLGMLKESIEYDKGEIKDKHNNE